jgi:PLP dependent protein
VPGVEGRLNDVRARVAAAASRAGRDPAAIRVIAVSKTLDAAAIEPVLAAGHLDFGENRVQEAQRKWPQLRQRFPDLTLSLVGPLQTNKARDAVALFDAIHSVDRDRLASALAREAARKNRTPTVFVQVNTGEEPQKSGVSPKQAADFVRRCQEGGLRILGLMCIPPLDVDPRLHFDMLRRLAEALGVPFLSMGMSADFELAIEHGATHVRVGTAIFGERG